MPKRSASCEDRFMSRETRTFLVYLGDDLHKRLKIAAATHGQPMTEIAARAIEGELDRMDSDGLTAEDICPWMEKDVPEVGVSG